MPYRSDKEAWVRRNEEAEARAASAEAALEELTAMKAKAPWRLAATALALLSLGAGLGWFLAPPENRPGSFTALSTQALTLQSHSRYVWRAVARNTTPLAAASEECTLSVDAQDNDGWEDQPAREIHVRLECGGRRLYSTSHHNVRGRNVGGCALETGGEAVLFCSLSWRFPSGVERFSIDTRGGFLRLHKDGAEATFETTPLDFRHVPPSARVRRGASTFESRATITHVSGVPSEGTFARPRVRVGAACHVAARSENGERESRCAVEVTCAGTRMEASGACALDELGQIERIVDLTVSEPADQRGDGNASVIFDVLERRLVLMEDNGHEAFLVQLSLESNRSRARFL